MSALVREELWARLREARLVGGDVPAVDGDRAPWFVRVMLGIAGWIGAVFLLGFVALGFVWVMKNSAASLAVGAGLCAAAAIAFRGAPRNDFMSQFALAVSLAGQALLVFGLAQSLERSLTPLALAVMLQQAVLFAAVPNFVHRVWTAWSGAWAGAIALADMGLQAYVPAATTAAFLAVWLQEFNHPRQGLLLRAGGYGLALAAVQSAVFHGDFWRWLRVMHSGVGAAGGTWVAAASGGAILLLAVAALLRRENVPLPSGPGRSALAGAAILALLSLKAPGIAPAAAILVVGYANGNRILAGLGILALLAYLSHYYYSLQITLLEKSAWLACAGLALLAARLAMRRAWPASGREVDHA